MPIGAESKFKGVIDLIDESMVVWTDELGDKPERSEIPDDLRDEANQHRQAMIEAIAETDDTLTDKFIEGEALTKEELKSALRRAVISGRAAPVFCGSALRNKGVQLLLDGVIDYLPSPMDVPDVVGFKPDTEEELSRPPSEDAPLSALVFKIVTDPYVGRLAYFRVYSGKLTKGSTVYNSTSYS